MISKKDNFFNKFGEIYFSEVCPKKFKGWKIHKKRTQLITVVNGSVKFFIKKKKLKINQKLLKLNIQIK